MLHATKFWLRSTNLALRYALRHLTASPEQRGGPPPRSSSRDAAARSALVGSDQIWADLVPSILRLALTVFHVVLTNLGLVSAIFGLVTTNAVVVLTTFHSLGKRREAPVSAELGLSWLGQWLGSARDRCTSALALACAARVSLEAKVGALGETPLHRAAQEDAPSVVSALLEARADPDLGDEHGDTAVHTAVLYAAPRALAELLARGADPAAENGSGELCRSGRGGSTVVACETAADKHACMSCHVPSCHVMSCRVVSYHVMS